MDLAGNHPHHRRLAMDGRANAVGQVAPFIAATVFAATYIGWQSPALVAVMAGVGLMYGFELARSGSLWPAILGHSALVLAAGFLSPIVLG
jgi:hypothetical protein